jgi:hypothetical protein
VDAAGNSEMPHKTVAFSVEAPPVIEPPVVEPPVVEPPVVNPPASGHDDDHDRDHGKHRGHDREDRRERGERLRAGSRAMIRGHWHVD